MSYRLTFHFRNATCPKKERKIPQDDIFTPFLQKEKTTTELYSTRLHPLIHLYKSQKKEKTEKKEKRKFRIFILLRLA